MRMPPLQFPYERGDDVLDVEPRVLGRYLRVKHDLKEQVAKLLFHMFKVLRSDLGDELIRLLLEIWDYRDVRLLLIPLAHPRPVQLVQHPLQLNKLRWGRSPS